MLDLTNRQISGALFIVMMSTLSSSRWTDQPTADPAPKVTQSVAIEDTTPIRMADKFFAAGRSRAAKVDMSPEHWRKRTIVFAHAVYTGIDEAEAFIEIVWRESRFDPQATNSTSGAFGLGQALPPEKMDNVRPDWRINPLTQLEWVAKYIDERYGSPLDALAHHDENGWY